MQSNMQEDKKNLIGRDRCCRDRMVVELTTIHVVSAYHELRKEFTFY